MKWEENICAYIRYLKDVRGLSAKTLLAYQQDLNSFSQWYYRLHDESASHEDLSPVMRQYAIHLSQSGKSASTFNRMISSLRGFSAYMQRIGRWKKDPLEGIKSAKQGRALPRFLFVSEIDELLQKSDDTESFTTLRNTAILEVLYSTGMRISELLSLLIRDMKERQHSLLIRGKGGKYRHVFFYASAQQAVSQYLGGRDKLLRKYRRSEEKKLFVNARGRPITARGVQWVLKTYAKKLNLQKNITPHMFRHSFATHIMEGGAGIRVVQELLGHSRLSTTQRYTHVGIKQLKEICDRVHPHSKGVVHD